MGTPRPHNGQTEVAILQTRLQTSQRLALLAGLWMLAWGLRVQHLDALMMLGDSVGPYLSAWVHPLNPKAHAPPYGWGLHPPFSLALLLGSSLRGAATVTMALHALVAPLAAAAAWRLSDWRGALVVGLVVAADPGLLDTAYSGSEGYLAPVWLAGALLLALRPDRASMAAPSLLAMAAMNHPLALCALPLMGLMPRTRWSLVGCALGAALFLTRGPFDASPGVEGISAWTALGAWMAEGGWSLPVLLLLGLAGLGLKGRRLLPALTLASLGLLLGAGLVLGYLRDHHLRLLLVPLALGLTALPRGWVFLGLLALRPPLQRSPEEGKPPRPGTLAMTESLASELSPPLVLEGLKLSGQQAAEPSAVLLDLALREGPIEAGPAWLILSFKRDEQGRRHALVPASELPVEQLCAGSPGGGVDALPLYLEGTGRAQLEAWRGRCE